MFSYSIPKTYTRQSLQVGYFAGCQWNITEGKITTRLKLRTLQFNWRFSCSTLYSVLSFCFHHFLLDISIIVNTFVLKLRSSTNIKNVQIICFETPPLPLQVSIHIPKLKVYGDFALQQPLISPDDNVKKLRDVFRVYSEWRKDVNIPHYKSP